MRGIGKSINVDMREHLFTLEDKYPALALVKISAKDLLHLSVAEGLGIMGEVTLLDLIKQTELNAVYRKAALWDIMEITSDILHEIPPLPPGYKMAVSSHDNLLSIEFIYDDLINELDVFLKYVKLEERNGRDLPLHLIEKLAYEFKSLRIPT